MKALGWVLLGVLCAWPSALPLLGPAPAQWVPQGASLYGLTLLPWLALAGLPLAQGASSPGPERMGEALLPLASALPALGMAAGLDLEQGRLLLAWDGGLLLLIAGPLLILLWRLSALNARLSPSAAWCHRLGWGFALPLGAALVCALEWAPSSSAGGLGDGLAWVRSVNPVLWCLEWSAWNTPSPGGAEVAFLLGYAGLILGMGTALARRGRA